MNKNPAAVSLGSQGGKKTKELKTKEDPDYFKKLSQKAVLARKKKSKNI